nr:MAG TPA: hypothetical protein [Caudoviricetes sp.]
MTHGISSFLVSEPMITRNVNFVKENIHKRC